MNKQANKMSFIVVRNDVVIAKFLRKWEAEKFIESNETHDYKLIVK